MPVPVIAASVQSVAQVVLQVIQKVAEASSLVSKMPGHETVTIMRARR